MGYQNSGNRSGPSHSGNYNGDNYGNNKDIQKICLVAEGSLFWSENRKDKNYNILVLEKLQELLNESALADVEIHINNMNNANLIGTGIAALS